MIRYKCPKCGRVKHSRDASGEVCSQCGVAMIRID